MSSVRQNFLSLIILITVCIIAWLILAQPVFAQDRPDSVWTFSQIRTDADKNDTLDYLGEEVTITGIANIETGLLHEQYLQSFVQNDSAGISIFSTDLPTPFRSGDSLIITGKIQDYLGMVEVEVNDYKVFPGAAEEPASKPLQEAIFNPKEYEGMLVEGEGVITEKGKIYNGKYLLVAPSDTSRSSIMLFVSNFHVLYDEFDFDLLSVGDRIYAKGVVGEYNPKFPEEQSSKVILRSPDDLRYAGLPRYYWYLSAGGLGMIILLVSGWIVMLRRQVDRRTNQYQEALEEKEVLLREIHHRVKNNLNIITGLIELQLDTTADKNARQVLQDSQSRIQSMATIHDKLYMTDSLSEIALDNYLKELVEALHSTFDNLNESVSLQFDMESVDLDADKIVPCGLLVNELVVNAFKHAFEPGRKGVLEIELKKQDDELELVIADNGPGLPAEFDFNGSGSLGSLLIGTFAAQLQARTEILDDRKGAAFKFTFSPDK